MSLLKSNYYTQQNTFFCMRSLESLVFYSCMIQALLPPACNNNTHTSTGNSMHHTKGKEPPVTGDVPHTYDLDDIEHNLGPMVPAG